MAEPLIFIDSSEIREGKLDEVKAAVRGMVEFIEANEARPLAYHVYLDEVGGRMTVVQVHPDSASMEDHLRVAAPVFRRFVGLIRLATMDVYGTPSEAVLGQLRAKIGMLGSATLVLHPHHAGFTRLGQDEAALERHAPSG